MGILDNELFVIFVDLLGIAEGLGHQIVFFLGTIGRDSGQDVNLKTLRQDIIGIVRRVLAASRNPQRSSIKFDINAILRVIGSDLRDNIFADNLTLFVRNWLDPYSGSAEESKQKES